LAEQLAVSRAVVREAVARLKAEGLVTSRQGSGVYVARCLGAGVFRMAAGVLGEAHQIEDIFELRLIIEVAAAERAALRRTPADVEAIEAALARMDEAVALSADGVRADDDFHCAIALASGNPLIGRFVAFVSHEFSASRAPTWSREGDCPRVGRSRPGRTSGFACGHRGWRPCCRAAGGPAASPPGCAAPGGGSGHTPRGAGIGYGQGDAVMGEQSGMPGFGRTEEDFSRVDVRRLVQALLAVLPAAHVLHDVEDLRPYECDGMAALRQVPMVVVLPETEAQVVDILKICAAQGVPVVARGAGTGLSGGAQPHRFGLVVSLARLKKIVSIDAHARRAVVQPGVRNLAISEAAAPYGLYYAPDPSSQIACTIGGNVAENSGGVHCLKYGLTIHNLLKVRGVSIAGDIVEFGSLALDAPGYDLLPLITGSEGMLAVVTEVTVKLTPKPQLAQCVLAAFDDVVKAGDAVAAIIAAGIIPAGLEMMDQPATAAVEEFVHAGYPLDAQAILLCESDGTPEEVAEEIARVRALLEQSGATEIRVSRDEAERLRFWAGRKAAFPAAGRISPDYYCMDGTIPRKRLGEMLKAIQAMETKVRHALHQRLSCRRWQLASAHPFRRQQTR
jgi:glycolate oxidase